MTPETLLDYCLAKPGARLDYPFGEKPACVKLGRRLFAQLYPDKATLNCDLMTGDFYRRLYPGAVVQGYHCPPVQQPYFNTVFLDGRVPDCELRRMADHAYQVVLGKLTKKERLAIGPESK